MGDYLKDNIAYIEAGDRSLASAILGADTAGIDVMQSRSGCPVPSVAGQDSKPMMVHSRVDPVREGERFAAEADISGKDLIVVIGFGFGYHCEALAALAGASANIIAVDFSHGLVRSALASRDLSGLLSRDNFFLLVRPGEDELAAVLKGRSSRNIIFMIHRGSWQVAPEYYTAALDMMKAFISTKDVNIATLARFEKTWCSNISRNVPAVSSSPGVSLFFGRFSGTAAIIAAAGPSLTQSLEFIRENSHKALVIAVDTSYKILMDNGITPHFCVTVDPQLINARYFEGAAPGETVLVADPTVHPSVFRLFPGRRVVTGVAFEMMKWIEDICGRKGDLAHGGSVSTSAYDFARRTGASPVIMVGQDLAFTSGLAHAKGSYLDEQIHNKTFRFMNAQMYNRRQLTYLPPLFVPAKNGGKARTTQKMIIFRDWFENRNDPDLVNASAGGVFIKGAANIEHSAVVIPAPPVSPSAVIDEVLAGATASAGPDERRRMAARVSDISEEIAEIVPVLERALERSAELSEMIASGSDKSDPGKAGYILAKLAEADAAIEAKEKSKGMLSFAMQRVIHTITEGYDTGGGSDNAGARSQFLYGGMLESARFIARLLEKMKVLLK